MNNRPLTKLSKDPNDFTPLTTNSLLMMKHSADVSTSGSAADMYHSHWKYTQHFANQFWARWSKEYLPTFSMELHRPITQLIRLELDS